MPALLPPLRRRDDGSRIVGVDLARCLALVGMICTHLLRPVTSDGQVTVVQQIAGGRASALFAVLAGVSMALVTGGSRPVAGLRLFQARCALVVRAVLIAGLGLLLGSLDSGIAVILTYYGVLFLLGIPFLTLRTRTLCWLAAAWAVVVPVLSHLVRPMVTTPELGQPTPDDLSTPLDLAVQLGLTGVYPALSWLAYLFLGIALGRLPLDRPAVAARVAMVGGALALAAWLVSHLVLSSPAVQGVLARSLTDPVQRWPFVEQRLIDGLYGTTPTDTWWWLLVASPHSTTPLDLVQTGGFAMLVIGVCVLLARTGPRLWSVVGGAGAMTLSLYTFHVVLASTVLDRTQPYAAQWHIWFVLGIGAAFAAARVKGPLEWVVAAAGRLAALGCTRLAAAGRS